MASEFGLLKYKEVYANLDGDTKLVKYGDEEYGFPCMTGEDLKSL